MQLSKNGNLNTFAISNNQSFISQVLKIVDPLGEKFDRLVVPWNFIFKVTLISKRQKSSFTQSELRSDI